MKKLAFLLIGILLGSILVPLLIEWFVILTHEPDSIRCDGGMGA